MTRRVGLLRLLAAAAGLLRLLAAAADDDGGCADAFGSDGLSGTSSSSSSMTI
jgi:hypothetical protein